MVILIPSRRILEEICFEENSHSQETIFPSNVPEFGLVSYMAGLHELLKNFYNIEYELTLPDDFSSRVLESIWEAIENSLEHGSKKHTPIRHSLFLGKRGICSGFRDEGGYFNREDIKEKFEEKIPLTEFDPDAGMCRIGVQLIYENSDIILIEKGTLYITQILETN